MKKVFLFVAVISAFSFDSCKKDRVCTCTTTSNNGTTTTATTYFASKKSNAELFCEGDATQRTTTNGSVAVTGDKTTCTLK